MPQTTAPVLQFTAFDFALMILIPIAASAVLFQWRSARMRDRVAPGALVLRYPRPLFAGFLMASAVWLFILTVAPHVLIDTGFRAIAVSLFLAATVGSLVLAAHAIGYRYRVCEEGIRRDGGLLRARKMAWSEIQAVDWHVSWDCLHLRHSSGSHLRLNSFLTPYADFEQVLYARVDSAKITLRARTHLENLRKPTKLDLAPARG